MEDLTIKVDGKEYDIRVEETDDGKILVYINGDVFEIDKPQDKQAAIFNRIKKGFGLEKINKKLGKFYELEFIPSESLDSCLAKLSPNKIKVISKKVFDIINILSKNPIKYNNSHINEEQFIIKKLGEIH